MAVAKATAADAAAAVKRKALLEIARSQSWKMKWYFNFLRRSIHERIRGGVKVKVKTIQYGNTFSTGGIC